MSKKSEMCGVIMSVLASPKPDAYSIDLEKKESFLKEKISKQRKDTANKMAEEFKKNNLRK